MAANGERRFFARVVGRVPGSCPILVEHELDAGQVEAGRSLGMSRGETMRRIILPQAALLVVPPTAGEFTNLVKGTSLLSTISVSELTRVAQQIIGVTFRPIEAYVAIAVVYFCLNATIAQGSLWFERVLRRRQGLA